ncbi:MAG: hypothetical protein IJ678_03795, partial [Kiritimatiellae bacterium]|nr:hypothetical protein [Kiritimatiellia bacterium]
MPATPDGGRAAYASPASIALQPGPGFKECRAVRGWGFSGGPGAPQTPDTLVEGPLRFVRAPECDVLLTPDGADALEVAFYPTGGVVRVPAAPAPYLAWNLATEQWDSFSVLPPHFPYATAFAENPRWSVVVTNFAYEAAPGAAPFASWRIERSGPSRASERVRLVETRSGSPSRAWEYGRTGDTLSLAFPDGTRAELLATAPDASGTALRDETVFDAGGAPVRRVRTTVWTHGGRDLPLVETVDPDGLSRTTRREWCRDETLTNVLGRLLSRQGPDGGWEAYEYDDLGRRVRTRTGWLGGGPSDPCRETLRAFDPPGFPAASDAPDDGTADAAIPRVETLLVCGVPVSKTLRHVSRDAMDYVRTETVRLLDPAETNLLAAWSDPRNPRSVRFEMPETTARPCSRLPERTIAPDGAVTQWSYGSGDWTPGADGAPGVFSPRRGGPYFRSVAIRGTRESSGLDPEGFPAALDGGVPLRTTRETTVVRRTGRLEVYRGTAVCTAPGDWRPVSWTETIRDALGRETATVASTGSRTAREWAGAFQTASVDALGVRTGFSQDALGRRVASVSVDPITGAAVATTNALDALGHVVSSVTTAGALRTGTQRTYDAAGRVVSETDVHGVETRHFHDTADGLSVVATVRGAEALRETSATYAYPDGRTAYVERNGKRAETYD